MCGICGVVAHRGTGLGITRGGLETMRDRLAHRGPDDAGVYWDEARGVALAHRRLSIIDPTPAGHQPMETPDGRHTIVYNGELYNNDEIRRDLEAEGVVFRSSCDTETVLHAVARWGPSAAGRLRGMYALGLWDRDTRKLTLARDGFGMKPVYWAQTTGRVVFGSEIPALLAHPAIAASHDPVAVSAYLTTIRTTMEDRTLFEGVRTLRPGEWITFDCSRDDHIKVRRTVPAQPTCGDDHHSLASVIEGSVLAHLRSDVPLCSLLSGGLDSTILATIAHGEAGALNTYVSGCPDAADGLADDFAFADEAAAWIGSSHTRVPVDQESFIERWPAMVGRLGVPLSTPNEVAIAAVAERLRADGHAVTLSGEGADELFAGYELPLVTAAAWIAANPDASPREDGASLLDSAAWLQTTNKSLFLNPAFIESSGADAELIAGYATGFTNAIDEARSGIDADDPSAVRLRASLTMQRRINLAGLLQRLDTATMLASVEGRTPFADARILAASERIPMAGLFGHSESAGSPSGTKIALREAFKSRVPSSIATRPKRSFPLPFMAWLPAMTESVSHSAFLQDVYTPEAIAFTMSDPTRQWNLAWPMYNLAIWADRWL